ncbi:hypothetical protein BJX70DRAFT_401903 [Aspergillus crustosus]
MDRSRKRPFLFVHSNGPTHMHERDENVKTDIRRHIMVDIGKARRKPPRNPRIDVRLRPLHRGEVQRVKLRNSAQRGERNASSADEHDQAIGSPNLPFWEQNPLVVLERHWEMDMFSAYGISLIVSEGKNRRANDNLATGFWFPFAFRASRFLGHFRQTLTSPNMLAAAAYAPENKFQMIALQRFTGTIACLETIISSPNLGIATANRVLQAVLASICYNFVCSEFTQALTHIKGLGHLISVKGGIESLRDDEDLRLMIFWVDITAALLFDRKPEYPLPSDLIPKCAHAVHDGFLPAPILNLASETRPGDNKHNTDIISCLQDLWVVATYIESDIAVNPDTPWQDEESIGLRLNPIVHRLLTLPPNSKLNSRRNSTVDSLCLGQIIWIIWIKRRYRSYPGSPAPYASKLVNMILQQRVWREEVDLLPVYLWLLVLCAISCGSHEQPMAMEMIIRVTQQWKITSWSEVMDYVYQMPWVSVLDTLCTDIESKLIPLVE